jgi:hypothetical protein
MTFSENFREGPAMLDGDHAQSSFGRPLDWHVIHEAHGSDVGKPWTTKTFADTVSWGSGSTPINPDGNAASGAIDGNLSVLCAVAESNFEAAGAG